MLWRRTRCTLVLLSPQSLEGLDREAQLSSIREELKLIRAESADQPEGEDRIWLADVAWERQCGPCCGLAALRMARSASSPPVEEGVEKGLEEGVQEEMEEGVEEGVEMRFEEKEEVGIGSRQSSGLEKTQPSSVQLAKLAAESGLTIELVLEPGGREQEGESLLQVSAH